MGNNSIQYSVVCNIQCYNSFSSPVAQCNQIAEGIIKMFLYSYIFFIAFFATTKKIQYYSFKVWNELSAPLWLPLFDMAECLRPRIFLKKIICTFDSL